MTGMTQTWEGKLQSVIRKAYKKPKWVTELLKLTGWQTDVLLKVLSREKCQSLKKKLSFHNCLSLLAFYTSFNSADTVLYFYII